MVMGFRVLPEAWPDWAIMILPPGAFLTLGVLMGTVNWLSEKKEAGGN
jgi:electron transport complex protein RnfE